MNRLSSGPYAWLHPEVLQHISVFVPGCPQPKDLRAEHLITHLRFTIRHWDLVHNLSAKVDSALQMDSRILCGGFCRMYNACSISILARITRLFHKLRLSTSSNRLTPVVLKKLASSSPQSFNTHLRTVTQQYLATQPGNMRLHVIRAKLLATLRTRITSFSSLTRAQVTCMKLQFILSKLFVTMPPMVCTAILQTWLHGYTTSHRMQEVARLPCYFCGRARNDTLTHIIRCPILWRHLDRVCMLQDSSDMHRLALHTTCKTTWSRHAVALCLCYRIYHSIRHNKGPLDFIEDHLKNSLAIIVRKRPDLRGCFGMRQYASSVNTSTPARVAANLVNYDGDIVLPLERSLWPIVTAITLAVDGSASLGQAGWGVTIADPSRPNTIDLCGPVTLAEGHLFIGAEVLSNNTGELTALYACFRHISAHIPHPVVIQYDSTYAVNIARRLSRARRNLLLARHVRLALDRITTPITWMKVQAHAGERLNEQADALAKLGSSGHMQGIDVAWYRL